MNTLTELILELNSRLGLNVHLEKSPHSEIEQARTVVQLLNEYLYQTHEGLGTTTFAGETFRYFSAFHKFWEANHESILAPQLNTEKAEETARCLSAAVSDYGPEILDLTLDTHGLAAAAVAQVRFFTANQDFRKPPAQQFAKYLEDPTRFDPEVILDEPAAFLGFIGVTGLSQSDKRQDFARNAAKFLIERNINAAAISSYYNHDALVIRNALVEAPNMGYGLKKANMLVRDMLVTGAWSKLKRLDSIDVPSDINTMKLALRTGILTTAIPLVSSFLDIFCHQISCIDRMTALAWRRVWEAWHRNNPETAPASPCLMDYLLYRIGREYCDDIVVYYECEAGHQFHYFGARLRKCLVCSRIGRKIEARAVARVLPCQVRNEDLPREDGNLMLKEGKLLRLFDGNCILRAICCPTSPTFKALNPPRSISIKGQTGWTESYSKRDRGGGGMMG